MTFLKFLQDTWRNLATINSSIAAERHLEPEATWGQFLDMCVLLDSETRSFPHSYGSTARVCILLTPWELLKRMIQRGVSWTMLEYYPRVSWYSRISIAIQNSSSLVTKTINMLTEGFSSGCSKQETAPSKIIFESSRSAETLMINVSRKSKRVVRVPPLLFAGTVQPYLLKVWNLVDLKLSECALNVKFSKAILQICFIGVKAWISWGVGYPIITIAIPEILHQLASYSLHQRWCCVRAQRHFASTFATTCHVFPFKNHIISNQLFVSFIPMSSKLGGKTVVSSNSKSQ